MTRKQAIDLFLVKLEKYLKKNKDYQSLLVQGTALAKNVEEKRQELAAYIGNKENFIKKAGRGENPAFYTFSELAYRYDAPVVLITAEEPGRELLNMLCYHKYTQAYKEFMNIETTSFNLEQQEDLKPKVERLNFVKENQFLLLELDTQLKNARVACTTMQQTAAKAVFKGMLKGKTRTEAVKIAKGVLANKKLEGEKPAPKGLVRYSTNIALKNMLTETLEPLQRERVAPYKTKAEKACAILAAQPRF